jgi:hypothetical protein
MPRKLNPEHGAEGADIRASDFWIESQARIFERFDEIARHWLDRRREDLDATRQSFEQLRSSNNIAELMRVQQEWVIGSMNRLAADMAELGTAAAKLAQTSVSQIGRTTEARANQLERAGEEIMSAAGSKPNIRAAE